MTMQLTFLGAVGTVTGSKTLVSAGRAQVLVDCGLFQGYKRLRLRNWRRPDFEPSRLDAVVLTHAHLDHSGWLPVLVRAGFRGPVYCTPGTADLCGLLLPDAARLQEEDASFANRHGTSRHRPALPLFDENDARRALRLLKPVPFDAPFEAAPGVEVSFAPAGHILGAALTQLTHRGATALFTGDLGRPDDLIMRPPRRGLETDHLVLESTYGGRQHPEGDPLEAIAQVITRTVERGGSVLIPAFAVGRAQELTLALDRLRRAGRIPEVPVFLDSPMAVKATHIYARHYAEHRLSADEVEHMAESARLVTQVEESKALTRMRHSRVIVSASGMLTGGRSLHHLVALAPNPANTIAFAGFQAPATRGGDLVAGSRSVKVHGQWIQIRAEVVSLDGFSAHADQPETLDWLRTLARPPRTVFLNHGEPAATEALRIAIREALGWDVVVPEEGQPYRLDPGVPARLVEPGGAT